MFHLYICVDIIPHLTTSWQLVHVARNPGISKDFIFFVILEYYLINYVKFSAIYVLTTSPLASDNRVLVRKIDGEYRARSGRVESVASSQPIR